MLESEGRENSCREVGQRLWGKCGPKDASRGLHAQGAVWPAVVVVEDEFVQVSFGFEGISPAADMRASLLEGLEKAFPFGIVHPAAGASHALGNAVCGQQLAEVLGSVLAALVAVDHLRCRMQRQGVGQGIAAQVAFLGIGQPPAYQVAGRKVHERSHVHEAFAD